MNRYGSFANDHDDADSRTEMPIDFQFDAKRLWGFAKKSSSRSPKSGGERRSNGGA
jgi:hypothetical protein